MRPWVKSGLANAMRFWEPRRLLYNAALGAFVVIWVVATWPHFRSALVLSSLRYLAVYALIVNVCYCAAYLADVLVRESAAGPVRRRRRWALWWLGTALTILVENYWIADEIYPFVR
jgi:hypothetical protein